MKTKILLLLLCLSFLCCKKSEKRNNEITKITLSTGVCGWICPYQTIEIDSSLTLRYHGMENGKLKGYFIGKISEKLWDSINHRFEIIGYKKFHSKYTAKASDDTSMYLKIDYQNQQKCVKAQSSGLPNYLDNTLYWLITLKDSIKLRQTTDTLSFDHENINHTNHPLPILIEKK
ncbi:DUF6438 domain-containing protein [Flavobacterium sp. RNTU_13]|uniref:DUF6438 domain-containing protein n=1 Tax=Flavobacterium sp. RNTU_13 TaxID=3375145 RepID=UPI0039878A5C